MAQNGAVVPPTQMEFVRNADFLLMKYTPSYLFDNPSVRSVAKEGDFLDQHLDATTLRHDKLYRSALAALKALVLLHQLGEELLNKDVLDMDEAEKDEFKTEAEHVLGTMGRALDDAEAVIGYPRPS